MASGSSLVSPEVLGVREDTWERAVVLMASKSSSSRLHMKLKARFASIDLIPLEHWVLVLYLFATMSKNAPVAPSGSAIPTLAK
jgi:hypothetical protein